MELDEAGNLVPLEILDASTRVLLPNQMEYQVVPLNFQALGCACF